MTYDKRLQHQIPRKDQGHLQSAAYDHKRAEERAEELQGISPVFRKLLKQRPLQPSPEQWRMFTQGLHRRLEAQDAPYAQTLRDRVSASDWALARWFWIFLALLALIAVGLFLTLSLPEPASPATAFLQMKAPGQEQVIALPELDPCDAPLSFTEG